MNIGIHGAAGRMGRQIASEIYGLQGVSLVAAVDHPSNPEQGQPYDTQAPEVVLRSSFDDGVRPDVIIDFSAPKATLALLAWCKTNSVALVIGTTGLTADEVAVVQEASVDFTVLFSPNMSVGVNALFELASIGARTVGLDWEFEIVEAHHRNKKDSPSGTAMRLAEHLADARNSTIDELGVYARHGLIGARTRDEIGVQTIRGGDIIGEHTVYLIGEGERIELTHRALTRGIFARGAVRAAIWLNGKPSGSLYSMRDVLGF